MYSCKDIASNEESPRTAVAETRQEIRNLFHRDVEAKQKILRAPLTNLDDWCDLPWSSRLVVQSLMKLNI